MDDEQAPSRRVRESERVFVAEGILSERHSISVNDAAILLSAMTAARGATPTALASQIIDATVAPDSYPTPYGTSYIEASDRPDRPRRPQTRGRP